jgi:hypothetical protein
MQKKWFEKMNESKTALFLIRFERYLEEETVN